jgi:hypothetical protein
MDGSVVGRGCLALMIHVVDTGRALPLAWRVRQGPKGHCPEDLHSAMVALVSGLVPEGASVVVLGDGECDGSRLQQTMPDAGWCYVCRTGCHMTASWDGESFRLDTLGACSKPGTRIELSAVLLTREDYGPIMLLCGWAKGEKDPLDLVTHMASAEEACRVDTKRFRIETFFSDQKSRGFPLQKSHLSHPPRLSRLFIAAC